MEPKKLLTGAFNHVRECRYGVMLYNINDIYIGGSLEHYGEFSEGEIEVFRQVARPGDTIVDVGANIGAHTLYFAKTVGAQGFVYAFEPQRIIFQALCANVALNSLIHVQCLPVALGERPGKTKVPVMDPVRQNNFAGLQLGEFPEGEIVDVVPLDSLHLPQCRLIKIDVEGMESSVLRGAVATIKAHQPFLYVENDRPDKSQELTRLIAELGYKMYWHEPFLYNPDNFYANPNNIFGTVSSHNLFCVPAAMNAVMQGFREALPGEIPRPIARDPLR